MISYVGEIHDILGALNSRHSRPGAAERERRHERHRKAALGGAWCRSDARGGWVLLENQRKTIGKPWENHGIMEDRGLGISWDIDVW